MTGERSGSPSGRQRNAELAGEQPDVMSIRLVGGIAEVVARLQISREAPDPATPMLPIAASPSAG